MCATFLSQISKYLFKKNMEPLEILNLSTFRGEYVNPTVIHLHPKKKSKFTLKTESYRRSGTKSIRKRREPRQRLKISKMIGLVFKCFRKSER